MFFSVVFGIHSVKSFLIQSSPSCKILDVLLTEKLKLDLKAEIKVVYTFS